jgi:hypothetical protein
LQVRVLPGSFHVGQRVCKFWHACVMQSTEENLAWHSMLRVAIGHTMSDDIEKMTAKSGHPESNQGPSDYCESPQSDALPTELQPA